MRKESTMETTTSSKPNGKPKDKAIAAVVAPTLTEVETTGAPAVEPAKALPGDQSEKPAGAPQASTAPRVAATPRLAKAEVSRRQVGPKIGPRTEEWLVGTWPTANEGAAVVLEGLPALYRRTLTEVRGELGAAQARLILDALNGVEATASLVGQRLGIAVRDAVEDGELPTKWAVDGKALLRTVNGFTAFQSAAIEWWAASFWRGAVDDGAFEARHVALVADGSGG